MSRPRTPERFWSRVQKYDGCWIWIGPVDKAGYGRQNGVGSHRVSWELTHGPIPSGMCVCHKCDNPPCVRPDHLFLGTHRDNYLDMIAKGRERHPRGSAHGRSRLTEEAVASARSAAACGKSVEEIAADLAAHPSTVASAIRGRTWTHVDGPRTKRAYHQLTEAQVLHARERVASGASVSSVARDMGVQEPALRYAVRTPTWRPGAPSTPKRRSQP